MKLTSAAQYLYYWALRERQLLACVVFPCVGHGGGGGLALLRLGNECLKILNRNNHPVTIKVKMYITCFDVDASLELNECLS